MVSWSLFFGRIPGKPCNRNIDNNQTLFWYSHIILTMKMSTTNKHGTQMVDLSFMMGRCSFNNQHLGFDQHPTNVGCSNFRYTTNNQINNAPEKHQRKKMTREDNQDIIHCYFKNNPTQRDWWKKGDSKYIRTVSTNRVVGDRRRGLPEIATTSRCMGGRYSFPWIAPLYPWNVSYNAEC